MLTVLSTYLHQNPHPIPILARYLAKVIHRPYWLPVPALPYALILGEMSTLVLDGHLLYSPNDCRNLDFNFRFNTAESALKDLLNHGQILEIQGSNALTLDGIVPAW